MRNALRPLAFTLLCLIWGSTWLVIKLGYGGLGPFNVAAIRFLLAGVVLVPLLHIFRVSWPRGRVQWGVVAFVGTVLFALDYGLIYWGEQWLDSGLTAVLFAVMPLTTTLMAHAYVPGERLTAARLGGAVIVLVGVVALFGENLRLDASLAWPMLAIVGSTVCAAAATVVMKRHGAGLHPIALNAPAMLLGALLLAGASLAAGDGFALPVDSATWSAIVYLALGGSVVTFLIYAWLLRTWSATTMSLVSVLTPLVALTLGIALRGERITPAILLGAALVLGGVTLALRPAPRQQAPTAAMPSPKSAPNTAPLQNQGRQGESGVGPRQRQNP